MFIQCGFIWLKNIELSAMMHSIDADETYVRLPATLQLIIIFGTKLKV